MNSKTMIQANSLDKLIDVFTYCYLNPNCKPQDISDFLGFSPRQADYYVSACRYLDLLDNKRKPTALAYRIFDEHKAEVREMVFAQIISDETISRIFARLYLLPQSDILAYAKTLLTEEFPGYSKAVYERRADNLVKWCERIIKYHNETIR